MKFESWIKTGILSSLTAIMFCSFSGCASTGWRAKFDAELPAFGHRNWIVIADSAYPKQSALGIETVYTYADQLDLVRVVLKEIEAASHVQANVYLDAELDFVTERDAPGIEDYRKKLRELLNGKEVNVMPHEEIIKKLDAGAELFNVLILKTNLAIPYTSVFLELDCGYWNTGKEQRLRDAIGKKQ